MSLPSDQFCRRIELNDLATVQYHNAVAVEDGIDAVCDGDDGAVLEDAASKHLLEERVGFNVDGSLGSGAGVLVKRQGRFQFDQLTVASSSTRMLLGVRSALASDTSCRCPWLRLDPKRKTRNH